MEQGRTGLSTSYMRWRSLESGVTIRNVNKTYEKRLEVVATRTRRRQGAIDTHRLLS